MRLKQTSQESFSESAANTAPGAANSAIDETLMEAKKLLEAKYAGLRQRVQHIRSVPLNITGRIQQKILDLDQQAANGIKVFQSKIATCMDVAAMKSMKEVMNSGSGGGSTEEKICKLSSLIHGTVCC